MELIGLVKVILGIAVIGLCVWLIEKHIPMDDVFKTAIRVIVVIVLLLYVIQRFLFPLLG